MTQKYTIDCVSQQTVKQMRRKFTQMKTAALINLRVVYLLNKLQDYFMETQGSLMCSGNPIGGA